MPDIITSETEFLASYNKNAYERPSVAVDLLVFTIADNQLKAVVVRRREYPFKDCLSLPGVFVGIDESLDDAAKRGISEKAGLTDIYFEQLYTWGSVERDPRMRIISVSYMALVPFEKLDFTDKANDIVLIDADNLSNITFAFDHKEIINYGRERIRGKVNYTTAAFNFLPSEFTLPQLQKIYEILLGKTLYKANFRKKINDLIEPTEKMSSGDAHRPSRYYVLRKQ